MNTIFDKVQRGDVALAALMTVLGGALMVENITAPTNASDIAHSIDSHSVWMLPAMVLVTLPILWRRRGTLPVIAVTAIALGLHVLAFGWVVRCGSALPLAFALAYGVGRLTQSRLESVVGLVATIGVQFLVLVQDSAAGLEILPFTAVIGAVAWGAGLRISSSEANRAEQSVPVIEYVRP
jgi:hypothetical protein